MPEPIIKLKDLDIIYNPGKENEFKAIQNVSMEIYPEEFVAFFGPSGCGKSTMFYTILGILPNSTGELLVKGKNPYLFSPEEMVKFQTKTIGIIYQAFYLISSLSVMDNVVLPLIFHGVNPGRRKKKAMELLRRFDIVQKADAYPDNLSGGQSQRVSVARSMVNNPDILLADEPTGNLDSVSTKQVMDALEEINQKDRKTVVMITHNAAQLIYCHRVFYMKDGKLVRTVPNPEKKQIAKIDRQKMLVTEIEELSKIYPYSSPVELKVKSLINYLTQGFTVGQVERLEKITKIVIERNMDKEKFAKLLCENYRDGGVGANEALAEIIAEKIFKILNQSEDVTRYRRRLKQNIFYQEEKVLIKRLTNYVLGEFKGEITPQRLRRIKELVYKRIAGLIRKEEFEDSLNLSIENEGVGLSKNASAKLTNYFEKLLTLGIEVEAPTH